MVNIDFNLINQETAQLLNGAINGKPTENRLVLAVSTTEKKSNGLIIPSVAKEEIPKKGVVIQTGPFTEDFENYANNIKIGDILSYGLYAGKQIYPKFIGLEDETVTQGLEFYIISVQEIIYIEPNE